MKNASRPANASAVWPLPAAFLLISACAVESPVPPTAIDQTERSVVYGEDDRTEVYAHADERLREIARRSVAAMFDLRTLDQSDPRDVQVRAGTLAEGLNLCSGERFGDQLRGASCSGTLIDDDLILTAGHCITNRSCPRRAFVFDWYYEREGQLANINADDIYLCDEIVARIQHPTSSDYALVKLDRPVGPNRVPAEVRRIDEPLAVGTPVTMIGYPSGVPAKIDSGGQVVEPGGARMTVFQATVDAFGGNSGSGVFDAAGRVVGVLVRGEPDYIRQGRCQRVAVLDEDRGDAGNAEDIVYVARALEALCATGWQSDPLCGDWGGTWCYACEETRQCLPEWSCIGWDDTPEVRFCAPPCMSDDDCRLDHKCTARGYCEPGRKDGCRGPDVWSFDGCGRPVLRLEECGPDRYCRDAMCVPRAAGDTCATAIPLASVTQAVEGTLAPGFAGDYAGSCGGIGADAVYAIEIEESTAVTALVSGFDSVLYLRATCEDAPSELACDDDSRPPGNRGSRLAADLEPGIHYLIVDAFDADAGDYTLGLSFGAQCPDFCPPNSLRCGIRGPEACEADLSGCWSWVPRPLCPSGTRCLRGECVDPGEGDRCDTASVLVAESQRLEGDLSGVYGDDLLGSCGGDGPDRVFELEIERDSRLVATVRGYEAVLYLRERCGSSLTEMACSASFPTRDGELSAHIEVDLAVGRYALILDAVDENVGPYELDIELTRRCEDACVADQRRCVGEGVEACAPGATGCTEWSKTRPCEPGEICREGACETVCEDECALEEGVCATGDARRACGPGASGCLAWQHPEPCPQAQRCVAGACVTPDAAGIHDASVDATPDAIVEPDAEGRDDGGGCDCRIGGRGRPDPMALGLVVGLGWLATRRRPY